MSFDKRIENVEDDLTPKEAVIYWMREAHQCDQFYRVQKDVLFPDSANRLQGTLDTLAVMRDVHQTIVGRRPPQSEEKLLRWALEEPPLESADHPGLQPDPAPEGRPDTGRTARTPAAGPSTHFCPTR